MTLQSVVSTTPPDEVPTWPFDGRGFVPDGWRPTLKVVKAVVNNETVITVKPSYVMRLVFALAFPTLLTLILYYVVPLIPFRSGKLGPISSFLLSGGAGLVLLGIFFGLVAVPFFSLQPLLPLRTCKLTSKRLAWHCGLHEYSVADISHIDRFYGTVHWINDLHWHDYVQLRVQTRDGKTHVLWHCEVSFNEDKAAIREFAELAGIPLREHLVDVDQRHPSSREQPRFFVPR